MTPIFQDAEQERLFRERGYVVVPFLGDETVQKLSDAFFRLHPQPQGKGFQANMYSADVEQRRAVHETISAAITPSLNQTLTGYRICVANYVAKPPTDDLSKVPMHQDWSFVDESQHVPVHVWCPLVDVNETNGCLRVVPLSHLTNNLIRPHFDEAYRNVMPQIEAEYAVPVPMRAGEAIFYHGRLLHGSQANRSPQRRIAVAMVAIPHNASLRHAYRLSPEQVELFEVRDEFFWRHRPGERPKDAVSLGVIGHRVDYIDHENL